MLNYEGIIRVLFEQFTTWSRAPHVWSTKIHDQVSVFQQGIPKYHGWWFSAEFINWLSHFGTHPKSYCCLCKKSGVYTVKCLYIYIYIYNLYIIYIYIYVYIISKIILYCCLCKKRPRWYPHDVPSICPVSFGHWNDSPNWRIRPFDAIWEWFPCPKRQLPVRLRRVVTT